jgi:hypothetical protein
MPVRRTILLVVSSLAAALSSGCSHDWEAFDPRLGTQGAGAASSSSSGMGGSGGSGQSSSSGAGDAGGSPCTVSLHDDFDDGEIDNLQWEVASKYSMVTESNGNLVVDVPVTPVDHSYGKLSARAAMNLAGCAVSVRVLKIPEPSATSYASLALNVGSDHAEIVAYKGTMYFKVYLGVDHLDFNSAPYDPIEHAYWRIREAAGITYWETSANGMQWHIQASKSNLLPVDAMKLSLSGGVDEVTATSLGVASFDDIHVGAP